MLNGQLNLSGETVKMIRSTITEAQLQVEEFGLQLQQEPLDELTQALAEQGALLKVIAYDFSIFGGIEGKVSADSLVDQKTGVSFCQVHVPTDKSTLERDGKARSIIPGMICSVEIKSGRRTILSYLLKPINKARQEAMSER